MSTLLTEIEKFLETHDMAPTKFGDDALGDRHFVRQLREGRDLRLSTLEKVRQFMATYRPDSRESSSEAAAA